MAMDGVAMIHVGNMDWIIETILASSKLLTEDQETTKWIYPSLNDQNSQAKFHRKTEIPFINSTIIVHIVYVSQKWGYPQIIKDIKVIRPF